MGGRHCHSAGRQLSIAVSPETAKLDLNAADPALLPPY